MTTDVVITDTFLVEVNELVAKAHKLLSDEPYGTIRNKRAIDVHYRLELAAQTLEESYPDEVMLRASVWNAADRLVIETFKVVPTRYRSQQ